MSQINEHFVQTAARLIDEFIASEVKVPVRPATDPEELYESLGIAIGDDGLPFEDVVEKLRLILAATPTSASTRFFNQLFGGRDKAATMAELLTPVANSSMYTFKAAGPQILIENEIIRRMLDVVGFDEGEGILTPGGSLSNMTALMLARDAAQDSAHDHGLRQRLIVYTSQESHYSIPKGAAMVGIGRNNVRHVPLDEIGAMDVNALYRMIQEDLDNGHKPAMINATAGTTILGAFDPIDPISDIALAHGIWLHVDGAFGGSILLSKKHRHLLQGIERADSVTWDAHKMLGVPLTCSVILTKRSGPFANSLDEPASYLFQQDEDELNPGKKSLQCGRRNDALKLWAAWQHHGSRGYARRIDKLFDLAAYALNVVESDPQLLLTKKPSSVNVCFEVIDKSSEQICAELDRQARLKVGYGIVDGRKVIRLVCVNPDLEPADLDTFFNEIKSVAASLPPGVNTAAPATTP